MDGPEKDDRHRGEESDEACFATSERPGGEPLQEARGGAGEPWDGMPSWCREIAEFAARQCRMERSVAQGSESLAAQKAVLARQSQAIEQLSQQVGNLRNLVQDLLQTNQLLESASKQQELMSERHYEERVIDPLVSWILPVFDLLDDARRSGHGADASLTDAARVGIAQFLAAYGVELFRSEPPAAFDRRVMRGIQSDPTANESLELTVARSLRCGVRRGDRILRPENVVLYRFEDKKDGLGGDAKKTLASDEPTREGE